MKITKFSDFIKEEINWGKQPWRSLKNLMNLEEPEEETDEPEPDEEN
jgi:hypothetical protein